MNRFLSTILSVVLVAFVATACADIPGDHPTAPVTPEGTALFSMEHDAEFETTGLHLVVSSAQELPGDFAALIASYGGTVTRSHSAIGVAVVDGLSDEAAAALAAEDGVFGVSPDLILPLDLPTDVSTAEATGGEVANDNPETAFFFARQWHLRAIEADVAWAAGHTGSAGVTVAILDTGIGYTHADVVGLVDLGRSISFVPSDDALVQQNFPGAHPVADLHWHGTHVAATVSSNAFAAAGVTSKTTLFGVKVCNVNGSCPTSGVLAGVMYAADQGADIMNLSLAGLFLKGANPGFVAGIHRAFIYASSQGTLIVVAAGNAATDLDRNIHPEAGHLPGLYASYCNTPGNVCVSATGPTASAGVNGPWENVDAPAGYTNFGRSAIDVAAPGGTAPGLVWAACSPFSLVIPICQTGTFILGAGGTSMASPHTAGVAALLVDVHGSNAPFVRSRLYQTADDLGEPGRDPFYGRGRVNAATAVGAN